MNRCDLSTDINISRLQYYYKQIFPFKALFEWLTFHEELDIRKRVFAFSLLSKYVDRYVLFNNSSEESFRSYILGKLPYRIDIGGFYCIILDKYSKKRLKQNMLIQYKPIVFDIDMEKERVNWKQIKEYMQLLNNELQDKFGFTKQLFVYSGMKGIHCWCCCKKSLTINDNGRSFIANYFKEKIKDLDVGVTSDKKHLLKLPFSIHSITTKISVPIDINQIDNFNADEVPTIKTATPRNMESYIQYFNSFVQSM